MALHSINIKALSPTLQDTVVDVILGGGIGEGETQGKLRELLALVVRFNELLQTVGDVLPQLLSSAGSELLGHPVLGLSDVEATLLLGQGDLTDTQVGTTHIQGEESSLFITIGESHNPGDIHGLR